MDNILFCSKNEHFDNILFCSKNEHFSVHYLYILLQNLA